MEDLAHQPIALRDPLEVMRLARMGAFHQSRLSFMRVLLRRMAAEAWHVEKAHWQIDTQGVGAAVYTVRTPERSYSLVAFAHDLPPEARSDRVIATAWDATFTLFDGVPDADDLARLAQNVPLQEAGRVSARELTLSRANRSVRLWSHVVDALAAGQQPEPARLNAVGYLMRTTAVYGSAKFGAADRDVIAERPEMAAPFQAEMLTVYLIRTFVADLVDHMARARNPNAARLSPANRRRLGIGNSTGLGMAPFLMNHPRLIHNWIAAREWALAEVRGVRSAEPERIAQFRNMVARATRNAHEWRTEHPGQQAKLADLRADMARLSAHLPAARLDAPDPWDRLWLWAEEQLSQEGQEQVVSLLLEPYGDLVDGATACMAADEAPWRIDGQMSLDTLRALIERVHPDALDIDWSDANEHARVWYVSAEKLEPRLGERAEEDLDPYAQPLCPAREAAMLHQAVAGHTGTVAAFLMRHPEHRHTVRRLQIAADYPYAEVRDNTLHAQMAPIDLLRCKLSFFGATRFDPRSDRWLRITMFQNAPFPDELAEGDPDDWSYPPP